MYKKLLAGSLATFGLMAFSAKNLARASSINQNQDRSVCSATDFAKGNKLNKSLQNFNFADYLVLRVSGSQIVARFAPLNRQKQALELDELAKKLGYKRFDWVNYVERDPHGIRDFQGRRLSLPYNDPPLGGYQYEAADYHPFYWDIEQCENCRSRHHYQHPKIKQKFALTFEDHPSDYRLRSGEAIEFVTHLVGVKSDATPRPHRIPQAYRLQAQGKRKAEPSQSPSETMGQQPRHQESDRTKDRKSQWDVLTTFKWQLTNNAAGRGRVSLMGVNLSASELSPATLALIANDGGTVPITALARDKDNHHNLQCQR